MSFNSTQYIKDRIRVTSSYKEAVSLRDQVWGLSGQIQLREFLELRDRVDRKLREFDRPIFDDAKVNIKFSGGKVITIDPRELNIMVAKGVMLSEHVFGLYPEAVDFEVVYNGFEEPLDRITLSDVDGANLSPDESVQLKSGMIKENIQRIVRLALKLVNFLFTTYSKVYPNLAEDLKFIKQKLEELFSRINSAYYV